MGKNIIEIKNGRIHMQKADCPDHICMNIGWLSDVPIVCMPNKLVIEFINNQKLIIKERLISQKICELK